LTTRSYCFSQPGGSPGGGVGIVAGGVGVAVCTGDALSVGEAVVPSVGDSAGAGDPLSAGDAVTAGAGEICATTADGLADGVCSPVWFDFAQPATAVATMRMAKAVMIDRLYITESLTCEVWIGPSCHALTRPKSLRRLTSRVVGFYPRSRRRSNRTEVVPCDDRVCPTASDFIA